MDSTRWAAIKTLTRPDRQVRHVERGQQLTNPTKAGKRRPSPMGRHLAAQHNTDPARVRAAGNALDARTRRRTIKRTHSARWRKGGGA